MPLVSLLVLCAVTALLTDRFSPAQPGRILVQSSIMAVIAMGMTSSSSAWLRSFGPLDRRAVGLVCQHGHAQAGIAAGVTAVRRRRGVGLANGLVIAFFTSIPSSPRSAPWCWFASSSFWSPAASRSPARPAFRLLCRLRLRPLPQHPLLVWVPAILLAALSFVMHATPYGGGSTPPAAGGRRPPFRASGSPLIASTYLVLSARRHRRGDARRPVPIGPTDAGDSTNSSRSPRYCWAAPCSRAAKACSKGRDRGFHDDRARQRARSAQCRFLLQRWR